MSAAGLLALPADVRLQFVAEGAANIVYRLILPDSTGAGATLGEADLDALPRPDSTSTPPPTEIEVDQDDRYGHLRSRLLRLRKDVSWIVPYQRLISRQNQLINPLFSRDEIVAADLVVLPEKLVAGLNADLRAAEAAGTRPMKRHGTLLAENERHALLVSDMSPRSDEEILIELKPKWLAQSPNAPSTAKRCRTCALRAMKTQASDHAIDEDVASFCPFDLVSGDESKLRHAVDIIVQQSKSAGGGSHQEAIRAKVLGFFTRSRLLHHLRSLQQRLDPEGILEYKSGVPENFLIATTLRDCTLFLRVPTSKYGEVEGRLGDLDLKDPGSGKVEYWTNAEKRMISEGWYDGRGHAVGCCLEQ